MVQAFLNNHNPRFGGQVWDLGRAPVTAWNPPEIRENFGATSTPLLIKDPTLKFGEWYIYAVSIGGEMGQAVMKGYINGELKGTADGLNVSFYEVAVGDHNPVAKNETSVINVAELILYDRVLSDAEMQIVTAYLGKKFGIGSQEPLDKDPIATDQWTFGEEIKFEFRGFKACVIVPKGAVDKERRWVWTSPGYLVFRKASNHGHTFYTEKLLAQGFHVVGLEMGAWRTTFGSPAGAALHHAFYQQVTQEYHLNKKARLVAQSNGGLIHYAWAFRHPDSVDRVLGLLPATDFRSWPRLEYVINPEAWPPHALAIPPGLSYNLTLAELESRITEFNPIDNLEPLARAGVKILHIHGDQDGTVPLGPNSEEFARRYRALGGPMDLDVARGYGHETPLPVYYESERAVQFLTE